MTGLDLDGPVSFGGIEGIYGIEALPLRWSERRSERTGWAT
jgi:hypothetical protein